MGTRSHCKVWLRACNNLLQLPPPPPPPPMYTSRFLEVPEDCQPYLAVPSVFGMVSSLIFTLVNSCVWPRFKINCHDRTNFTKSSCARQAVSNAHTVLLLICLRHADGRYLILFAVENTEQFHRAHFLEMLTYTGLSKLVI